jgi:hypothetical protein
VLSGYLPALEAGEQLDAISAAVAPHLKQHDYRALVRRLGVQASALDPSTPREPMEKISHDPAAAAEWFASQGVRVNMSA